MTINRDVFFSLIRSTAPFRGRLDQSQVDGLNFILDEWEARYPDGDVRWLANFLGQSAHETGARMQPVREGFATTDAEARRIVAKRPYAVEVGGHVYYGRGHIQLTHYQNYVTMGAALGIDLANNPDLALDPLISVQIMFEGMVNGRFTGVGLPTYFNATRDDPLNARRIVNGMDAAEIVAGYHRGFLAALQAATAPRHEAVTTMPKPTQDTPMGSSLPPLYPEDRKPAIKSKTQWATTATVVGGTATSVGSAARAVDPRGRLAEFLANNPEIFVLLGIIVMIGGGFLLWKWLDTRAKQVKD